MYFAIPSRPLSGPEKVGALMIALGAERSAEILSHLNPEEVDRVIAQVAAMQGIDWETREGVLSEFRAAYELGQGVSIGGLNYAEDILGRALGPEQASRVSERLRTDEAAEPEAGSYLAAAPVDQLEAVLADEHPQTIAVAIAQVAADRAAQVLARLPKDVQVEVGRRLADSSAVPPEMVAEIDRVLQVKAGAHRRRRSNLGPHALANVLSAADRATERAVLDSLDPQVAEQVRRGMFVFEDLGRLDERDLQNVLRSAGAQDLSFALKGADETLRALCFNNMSERAAEAVREDMELNQRVRPSDVEAAQQRICAVVREMIKSGEIVLAEAESA